MDMSLIILLTVVCMLTYTFEITFGIAGTIIMLTVMTFFIDAKTLVIYSVLPQIIVASIALIRTPKTIDVRFLAGMVVFAAIGIVLGFYIFYTLDSTTFQYLLAVAISLSGLYLVMQPKPLQIGTWTGRGLDTTAGMGMALFGISGPIAMTRLLASFDNKTVIRNYALAFFLSLNLFRAGGYVMNDTITPEIGRMMLYSAPFLLVTLWFANGLHYRVNDAVFRRVVAWIILLGGVSLFFA
ncbi:MAG: sulfite exporter TauE/SafE family protein [Granulosicoccaceae bacterium]|jgi:uncharacterized membrane protein YfcA